MSLPDPLLSGTNNVPQQSFVRWNDPYGNELAAVNRDGTLYSQGIRTNPSSGVSGSLQTQSATHILTAAEILQGWCLTPIVWKTPFPDLNYLIFTGVTSLLQDSADIAVGAAHDITVNGCNVLTILTAAIPLVQGQLDLLGLVTNQSYSFTPPTSNVYTLNVVVGVPTSTGSNLDALTVYATYTDHEGVQTTTLTSANRNQATQSVIGAPIYALNTGMITITTAYTTSKVSGTQSGTSFSTLNATMIQNVTGATGTLLNLPSDGAGSTMYLAFVSTSPAPDNHNAWTSESDSGATFTPSGTYALPTIDSFPFNFHVRVTQTPNNSIIYEPGDVFIVNGLAYHS